MVFHASFSRSFNEYRPPLAIFAPIKLLQVDNVIPLDLLFEETQPSVLMIVAICMDSSWENPNAVAEKTYMNRLLRNIFNLIRVSALFYSIDISLRAVSLFD